jgi:hypothetical protein
MKIVLQIENLRSKCLLNFQVEGDFGSPISEVSGLLQYRITKEAIGKFISFQCTPVRDDGIVGDKRICMGQERIRPGNTFMWEHSNKKLFYFFLLLCAKMKFNINNM